MIKDKNSLERRFLFGAIYEKQGRGWPRKGFTNAVIKICDGVRETARLIETRRVWISLERVQRRVASDPTVHDAQSKSMKVAEDLHKFSGRCVRRLVVKYKSVIESASPTCSAIHSIRFSEASNISKNFKLPISCF